MRAIQLAKKGQGYVEPNPMVGAVVVKDEQLLSEGYHQRFGEPHAEVNALSHLSPEQIRGSTLYVTLEPCSHFGKTPPCVDLVIQMNPQRVVIGLEDPFHEVQGKGIQKLRESGIEVTLGVAQDECEVLLAPYLKRIRTGLPWVIGKWAMTLDGRMSTYTGNSQWITAETTRRHAHLTRGRVDAILIGIGTAIADDPLLTARPSAIRIATRIVVDSHARLPISSRLVQSAAEIPLIVACGPEASQAAIDALEDHQCEVIQSFESSPADRLQLLMAELGDRNFTNLVIDGGPRILGSFFDIQAIDEIHAYIGTKIVGGAPKSVPNQGQGISWMNKATTLINREVQTLDTDLFVSGHCRYLK